MTDKNSIFVKNRIIPDMMLGLIVFLTTLSAELFLFFGYIGEKGLRLGFLFLPFIFVFVFLILRRLRLKQHYMIGSHILFIVLVSVAASLITRADPLETAEIVFSGIIQALYSLSQRYRVTDLVVDTGILFPSITVNVISFLVISYFENTEFLSLILVDSVLVVTFFFVARQNNVLEVDYYHSLKSEARNGYSVKRQNRQNMIIIVLGIAISLLLIFFFPVDAVANAIRTLIVNLFYLLVRLLPKNKSGVNRPEYGLVPVEQEVMEGGEANIFLKIFVLLLFLLSVAGFFVFVIMSIKAFLARYRMPEDKPSVSPDGTVVDLIENLSRTKQSGRSSLDFGKGYEREIRKKFYRKVRRGMKDGLPVGKTSSPRQIEKVLLKNGDTSMPELTDAYEKVRYRKVPGKYV